MLIMIENLEEREREGEGERARERESVKFFNLYFYNSN